ncbi:inner centromere protein A-like isoform X6 [Topomyia yanbarensis]|uniref:inner centromere protein A-like isoform X6 n=1 Tax=Topomyia yanbarensis TaxID=2498891 RepID=UPI00273AC632|nr:inner centromere protein A-like isoform X6 [Topomyia yanbarensis]XP_058840222.1 inner centromere protein A-like isoform X6 [Topomyia yanbarensis]
MGTDMMGMANELDRIPSTTLAALRGILVKSLSRENLSLTDQQLLVYRKDRHVSFNVAGNRDANVQKQTRPSSANKDNRPHSVAHTLHWFACVGEDYDINGFNNEEEQQKEREERIKQIKERQNEERQRKLEELKAQALAAQKFREQKEEERRRRMEDLRRRENDRRSQVEERRRAIQEADNERRQYILQKNQERDQRMETKRRNERSSIQFAFGSSTPRMIESGDSGMSSSFWTNRRATSITNVAYTGAPLTRRSSERELTDGSSKKRATSASGLDRSTDDMRRMSSSMYEVFNWAQTSECPKKLTLSLAGTGINIDEPPSSAERAAAAAIGGATRRDDSADMSYQRTVNRRKTDLMPTIPSPRDSSRSSLGTHTPRTPGRAFSMTRLDQLAQPRRRNGEHISAIVERERRQAMELENLTRLSLSSSRSSPTADGSAKRMSRSMSQLASSSSAAKYRNQSQERHSGGRPGRKSSFNSSLLGETLMMNRSDTSKSMSQLNTAGRVPRITKTERLRQQVREQLNGSAQMTTTMMLSMSTTATEKPPLPKTSATSSSASSTTMERKRPQSGTSTPAKPPTAPDSAKKHSVEKQRVSSARGTPKAASTPLQSPGPEKANRSIHDSLQQKQSTLPVTLVKQGSSASAKSTEEKVENGTPKQPVEAVVQSETVTTVVETAEKQQQQEQTIITEIKVEETHVESEIVEKIPQVPNQLEVSNHEEKRDETKDTNSLEPEQNGDGSNVDLMTASMHAKRISTEEEAKAALAERRRLAREEAERQAELERQRIEAEEEAERQRQLEEEERLRMLEEETIRLGEEQRRLEEERLQQAIEEAKKRDEEERLRREEEARQKVEREESERKAREEAERQRIEMAERLKKEEKEREERRKRVEAIMSRTRAKGSANNTPTKQSDDNREDVMSKSEIVTSSATTATNVDTTMSMTESMLESVSQQHPEAESVSQVPAEASEKVDLLAQDVQTLVLVEDGDDQNQQNNNNNSSLNNNHNNNSMDTAIITNASAEYERSVTEKENYLLGSFNNNLNSNVVASNGGDSDIGSSQQPSSLESSSTPVGVTTNGKSTPGATTIAETTELIIEDAIMSGQTNGHKNGSIDNVFAQIPSAVEGSPKFLVHFDTGSHSDELALSPAAGIVESSEHYPLLETPSTNTATTAAAAAQLIDFGSFQSLTEEVQPQSAAIVDHDPFNLNNNNNYNNASSSENLIDSSSFGTSSSPTATSLFTGSDINMISNSNFLNNNATRLVATSDSQDNRDLSLL